MKASRHSDDSSIGSIESIRDLGNGVLHSFDFSCFIYFNLFALIVFHLCGHSAPHQLFPKSTNFVKLIKGPKTSL